MPAARAQKVSRSRHHQRQAKSSRGSYAQMQVCHTTPRHKALIQNRPLYKNRSKGGPFYGANACHHRQLCMRGVGGGMLLPQGIKIERQYMSSPLHIGNNKVLGKRFFQPFSTNKRTSMVGRMGMPMPHNTAVRVTAGSFHLNGPSGQALLLLAGNGSLLK